MHKTIEAVRAVDPERQIIIDGLGVGNFAMPELADTGTIHGTRGYAPSALPHFKAQWCEATKGITEDRALSRKSSMATAWTRSSWRSSSRNPSLNLADLFSSN
jgi:hypothetical protein